MFKTSGFFGSGQIYLKNSFLFYNFVTHDTPEAVDWVSFVSLKMFCSPIHNLDLRVLLLLLLLLLVVVVVVVVVVVLYNLHPLVTVMW